MSDFDEKDIHKDVTSDFAPEDIAPQKMGAAEAGLLGAEQGLTLGTSDEMSGGVGAGLDATQELLNKLGLSVLRFLKLIKNFQMLVLKVILGLNQL
jgi:3-hydroxyisobutyrate dehydrogenase-like beta-hydroxyacid dehydrogenase